MASMVFALSCHYSSRRISVCLSLYVSPCVIISTSQRTPENNVPPAPFELHAVAFQNKIMVTWEPSLDTSIMIRGYILGYGPGIPDAVVKSLPSSQTQYTIPNLTPNTLYVLKLRAFNQVGEGQSLYEDVSTTPPGSKFPIISLMLACVVFST